MHFISIALGKLFPVFLFLFPFGWCKLQKVMKSVVVLNCLQKLFFKYGIKTWKRLFMGFAWSLAYKLNCNQALSFLHSKRFLLCFCGFYRLLHNNAQLRWNRTPRIEPSRQNKQTKSLQCQLFSVCMNWFATNVFVATMKCYNTNMKWWTWQFQHHCNLHHKMDGGRSHEI